MHNINRRVKKMANFYIDKSQISNGKAVIDGEEAKHISRVLRMKTGDSVVLCDGSGMFYSARLCDFDGKTVTAEIEDVYRAPSEPKLSITLYQGAPKAAKLELIVQKATEIGVVRIVPMNTARTVAKLEKASKLDRLRKIAREAAKQCKRGIVPEISEPVSFKEAVGLAAADELAIIPYEEETENSLKNILRGKNISSLSIMIGPEGGFDEGEIRLAAENSVIPVTLGKRILRTETAGLAVSAVSLYELGDME